MQPDGQGCEQRGLIHVFSPKFGFMVSTPPFQQYACPAHISMPVGSLQDWRKLVGLLPGNECGHSYYGAQPDGPRRYRRLACRQFANEAYPATGLGRRTQALRYFLWRRGRGIPSGGRDRKCPEHFGISSKRSGGVQSINSQEAFESARRLERSSVTTCGATRSGARPHGGDSHVRKTLARQTSGMR